MAGPAALLALIPVGSANAAPPRVPADFFGVNYQAITYHSEATRRTHIDAFSGAGIRHVRLNVSWAQVEPVAPSGGSHDYRWAKTDERILDLARRNVRPQALITQSPNWARDKTSENACTRAASIRPSLLNPYIDLTGAVARRYGRGGRFWDLHPGLDRRPVIRYELWNEANLRGGWCPTPQPSAYANMFVRSARAIKAADPGAEVLIGGLAIPRTEDASYLNPSTFLARAVAAHPDFVREADGVAVHVYPATDPNLQLKKVATFRAELRNGRIPDSKPMLINELGWSTYGGPYPVPEPERATAYAEAASKLSRTNCNVLGLLPHTWTTQQTGTNMQQYFGIAHPRTAELYPSAEAFTRGISLMRGELAEEPPRETLAACEGMPLPDQDRDGVRDENDYYPLDPDRTTKGDGGGSGSGGGGSGSGGGGSGADGGGAAAIDAARARRCTGRLLVLTSRIAASTDRAERRALKRRFLRVERRCVPCKRRIVRIRRRLNRAGAAERPALRARLGRVRRRCAPCVRRLRSLAADWVFAADATERGAYARRHIRVLRRRCRP